MKFVPRNFSTRRFHKKICKRKTSSFYNDKYPKNQVKPLLSPHKTFLLKLEGQDNTPFFKLLQCELFSQRDFRNV